MLLILIHMQFGLLNVGFWVTFIARLGSTVAHWYVIRIRIWKSLVQTSLKTKNYWIWIDAGSLRFKIYTMLFVYIHGQRPLFLGYIHCMVIWTLEINSKIVWIMNHSLGGLIEFPTSGVYRFQIPTTEVLNGKSQKSKLVANFGMTVPFLLWYYCVELCINHRNWMACSTEFSWGIKCIVILYSLFFLIICWICMFMHGKYNNGQKKFLLDVLDFLFVLKYFIVTYENFEISFSGFRFVVGQG